MRKKQISKPGGSGATRGWGCGTVILGTETGEIGVGRSRIYGTLVQCGVSRRSSEASFYLAYWTIEATQLRNRYVRVCPCAFAPRSLGVGRKKSNGSASKAFGANIFGHPETTVPLEAKQGVPIEGKKHGRMLGHSTKRLGSTTWPFDSTPPPFGGTAKPFGLRVGFG